MLSSTSVARSRIKLGKYGTSLGNRWKTIKGRLSRGNLRYYLGCSCSCSGISNSTCDWKNGKIAIASIGRDSAAQRESGSARRVARKDERSRDIWRMISDGHWEGAMDLQAEELSHTYGWRQ
jgi:hypothetical protein